ncbi:MAG: aldehyde dehydrogenase family protein, partial [Planctomycetota bacterium]
LPMLVRERLAARTPIVVSDGRLPEVADVLAAAAQASELPRGVLQVLHGPTRELLALALDDPLGDGALVASGSLERMSELRRLCERHGIDPRLAALRAGAAEIMAGEDLARAAEELVERAFGRARTLGGQLSGALARVHCPARAFSRFSELLLETLAASPATRRPVPQIDGAALARAHAACELGLDEGATLIAGGEEDGERRTFAPTVLTNVESYMESARRQEPVPVLCLLRA